MKEIAIIFCIQRWVSYYSLVYVVNNQIKSLIDNGYRLRVLLLEGCPSGLYKNKVDYRSCIPCCLYDDKKYKDKGVPSVIVGKIEKILTNNLRDIDVVITHDLLYLPKYFIYNAAIRQTGIKLKKIKWLHWVHSHPQIIHKNVKYPYNVLWRGMANSKFICVNKTYKIFFAKMYNVSTKAISTVYNYRDIFDFLKIDKLAKIIIKRADLLSADVVSIMPVSLNRIRKQLEINIYLMAALKERGCSVKLVFAAPFTHSIDAFYFLRLKWLAHKIGLSDNEVIFTFDLDRRLHKGCPEGTIRGLFQVSNIFIQPSLHEACSIILLEAAITKNLCVLNESVASFKELVGDNAIWIKCGDLYDVLRKQYSYFGKRVPYNYFLRHYIDNKKHYLKYACIIKKAIDKNKTTALFTKIKKEFNAKIIFGRQLKSLIEG